MNSIQFYLRVLALLGPEARLSWQLAIGNLALAAAQFAEPILFGRVIGALAGDADQHAAESWGALAPLLAGWGGFGLFIVVCGAFVALYAGRLAHLQRQAVLTEYFEHVLQLPPRGNGGAPSERLTKVMLTGADTLWAWWLTFFREHLAALVSLIVLLPATLLLNWQLALIVIALAIAFAVVTLLVMRNTATLQSVVAGHYIDLSGQAADTLSNVALVQSFTRLDVEVAGLKNVASRLLSAQLRVSFWWAAATVLTRTATIVTMLMIVVLGSWLYFRGQASIGEIVAFVIIAALVISRTEQVVGFAYRASMERPRLLEFFDALDTNPAVRDRPDAVDPGRVHGLVEFKDVSFSYDGKRPAVADLSFTALPSQIIALVGTGGAGKSTVLALLHRDFDPQSGQVTIDGMDIRSLTLLALRRNIGVVPDETPLFNRSIGENLQVAKPDATDEDMRAACERAQALDFIEHNAEGFAAGVGEAGRPLTRDEQKRLSIARMFLKDPPILLLDETTQAADAATETKVQTALDEVMKGRTTFVIARHLSTVRNANQILVLEDGRVVESGTFDELMQRGGPFAKLAKKQFPAA
jgi:glucan exporter ATP-binding protein